MQTPCGCSGQTTQQQKKEAEKEEEEEEREEWEEEEEEKKDQEHDEDRDLWFMSLQIQRFCSNGKLLAGILLPGFESR